MIKRDNKNSIDAEWIEIIIEDQVPKKDEGQVDEEVVVVLLEKEHLRFYDKLRQRMESFISNRTGERTDSAVKYILLAPDLFVLFARLIQDRRVSMKSKAMAGIVIAYFISPIDIIPEAVFGPIGFIDDIILAAYALNKMMKDVEQSVLYEHWNGNADLLETIQELLKNAEELVDNKVLSLIKKVLK